MDGIIHPIDPIRRPVNVNDGWSPRHPGTRQRSAGHEPIPLKAMISITSKEPVKRGDTVTLSAKGSRGPIQSYQWTFIVAGDAANDTVTEEFREVKLQPGVHKEGISITFVALRSLLVTLTVSDGALTSSTSLNLEVRARKFHTTFRYAGEKPLRTTGHIHVKPDLSLALGRNVCTLDGLTGDQSSGHYLHHGKDDSAWENPKTGFTLSRVDEPGGPFDGFWYVANYSVRVDRTSLINAELAENRRIYKINKASGHVHEAAFKSLVKQVQAHEQMHSTLLEEELRKSDPAMKIEGFIHRDQAVLRAIVNSALTDAENNLGSATADKNVMARLRLMGFNKPCTVLLPVLGSDWTFKGDYEDYTFASMADIGCDD